MDDMEIIEEEDPIAASDPDFKLWLGNLKANTSALKVILKLTEFIDGDSNDMEDDDDFEDEDAMSDDCEIDDGTKETGQVIDLDAFRLECFTDVCKCIPAVIERTEAVPMLIGLSRQAEDALDEL